MKNLETITQKINFNRKIDFEISDFIDNDELTDLESFDDLYELLDEKGAFNIEIIYYYKAIEFLRNNDASLTRSLEIAEEYGYAIKDINSELLASLLASEIIRDDFRDLYYEIDKYFVANRH